MTLDTRFEWCLALIVLFILVAFAFALTFSSDWSEYEEIEETKKTSDSDHPAQQENDYSAAPRSPDDKAEAKRRQRQKAYRSSQARLIHVAAGLNVLTAVAALAGFGALYLLYGTLDATRQQARTTQQQFQTAQRQFEMTERPWVGLTKATVTQAPSDTTLRTRIYYENAGHSPASEVLFTGWVAASSASDNVRNISAWCSENPIASENAKVGWGSLLLPGQVSMSEQDTLPLKAETIEYIREQLGLKPKPSMPTKLPPEVVVMVGCVDYMWGDTCYRTRFYLEYKPIPIKEYPFGTFSIWDYGKNDTAETQHCKDRK